MNNDKKKKTVFWIALVIVCALAVLSGILFAGCGKKTAAENADQLVDPNANVKVAECYGCDLSALYGEDQPNLLVYFFEGSGRMAHAMGEEVAATGTYTVNGNEITTELMAEDSDEVIKTDKYILDGKYLLIESGMYDGQIPDEDTFDTVAETEDATGIQIKYEFKKDGTYTCTEVPKGKDPIVMNGTYERDGNLINRTLSGIELMPFYVYKGHLFPSYYVETDASELNLDENAELSE